MDEQLRTRLAEGGIGRSAVAREPLEGLAEKYSGAALERVILDDGRALVLKHLPVEGDWLTRATAGAGRLHRLWTSGLLDTAAAAVDHAIIDCVATDDGWTVVMRDASAELLPPHTRVSRTTSSLLLGGLARLHEIDVRRPVEGLCSIGDRYRMFAPAFHRNDTGPGRHPSRDRIVAGWEVFWEAVPPDVADAVRRVHHDPFPLARELERFPMVLLHGDAKLENLGLSSGRLVAIDWGDLTGLGPAEVDVAWYALKGAARIGVDPGALISDYEAAAGRRLDPSAFALASVGSLAQMGFRMATSARDGVPDDQAIGEAHLRWWVERVRGVLEKLPY